ncbi:MULTISPECIES: hypothetical protein [unclassified Streptomyces]|uniref:hypothetical protein n=1 Tax=unclassified Streptomyces TaxID=2593676 RepID=UPI00278C7904|nr:MULTISPECIES: hypothetical protein [unclassified Streptomyces]
MTGTTAWLVRAEYGLGLLGSVVLFFAHLDEVRWIPALVLFAYIDVIGYLPGAFRYHRAHSRDKAAGQATGTEIPKVYYVLYNVMHSLVTQGLLALVWISLWGFEWALLALPIHLFGDRAIFGNFLKPFAVSFEPETHPAYRRFRGEFGAATAVVRGPRSAHSVRTGSL